ncbi:class I SAM-dependent methyltransferase [Patescibacteria group bacterium]
MKTGNEYIKTIIKQYDEMSEVYDNFPISAKKNVNLFLNKMPEMRDKALDIGSGSGRLVKKLSNHFNEVYGFDISPGMINYAKRECKNNKNIVLDVMDARNMNYDKNSFDYIVSHTTLHHLSKDDQLIVLHKIKETLKPGGKVVIIEIVAKGLMKKYPHIVRKIGAFLTLAVNLIKLNKNSFSDYKKSTHPAWIAHLKTDEFLSPEDFKQIYISVFNNAEITEIKKEFLMNHLFVLEWVKPKD